MRFDRHWCSCRCRFCCRRRSLVAFFIRLNPADANIAAHRGATSLRTHLGHFIPIIAFFYNLTVTPAGIHNAVPARTNAQVFRQLSLLLSLPSSHSSHSAESGTASTRRMPSPQGPPALISTGIRIIAVAIVTLFDASLNRAIPTLPSRIGATIGVNIVPIIAATTFPGRYRLDTGHFDIHRYGCRFRRRPIITFLAGLNDVVTTPRQQALLQASFSIWLPSSHSSVGSSTSSPHAVAEHAALRQMPGRAAQSVRSARDPSSHATRTWSSHWLVPLGKLLVIARY